MEFETVLVLAIRVLVPLLIFRWPLWGGIAALAADGFDVVIWSLIGGYPDNYHNVDKFPDQYYLTIELIVSVMRWQSLPARVSVALYAWRLFGFVMYEITGARDFLVASPNVFEQFFLIVSAIYTYAAWYEITGRRIAIWLGILTPIWLVKEYIHHHLKVWDDLVAVEVFESIFEVTVDWLADWYVVLLAVGLPLLAATLLLARAGRLTWLREWFAGQLYIRGYPQKAERGA